MKDEELADKYAEEYFGKKTELVELWKLKSCKDNFLAGLKAGRPQWHKVADGDLPKVGVQVLSEQGTLVIYKGDGFNWIEYSPNADNIKLRKWEEPIAWCEIPTFDKE